MASYAHWWPNDPLAISDAGRAPTMTILRRAGLVGSIQSKDSRTFKCSSSIFGINVGSYFIRNAPGEEGKNPGETCPLEPESAQSHCPDSTTERPSSRIRDPATSSREYRSRRDTHHEELESPSLPLRPCRRMLGLCGRDIRSVPAVDRIRPPSVEFVEEILKNRSRLWKKPGVFTVSLNRQRQENFAGATVTHLRCYSSP